MARMYGQRAEINGGVVMVTSGMQDVVAAVLMQDGLDAVATR